MSSTPFVRLIATRSITLWCAGNITRGWVNDEKVPGYREEDGVAPNSQTETFVALGLYVDNWRWQDVPFYSALESALPGRPRKSRFSFAACRISPFRQRPRSIGSPPAGHVDSAR
jgi:glucose-6-phosphate 1-dehydrogenase